jgi:site-specific recombinase XerD
MVTPLRQRFIDDLRLRNFAPKTIKAYVAGVVRFARHFGRSPADLGAEDVRAFQLDLLRAGATWSLYNQSVCALRFLYGVTLNRPEVVHAIPYGKRPKTLPSVLSPDEIVRLIETAKPGRRRVMIQTAYACGLRINELLHLQISDIDSARMVVVVRQGKGRKDRLVPMSPRLLAELRAYWKQDRPTPWLFPGLIPGRPVTDGSASRWFQDLVVQAGFGKRVTWHTLRHSFATHLLEAGVDLPTLQALLGHSHLRATIGYLHVSTRHLKRMPSLLDLLAVPSPAASTPKTEGPA